ncbi:MAG: hypothetical protein ACT4OS_05850 [Acidimicrobiales bacterium]
MTSGRLLAFTPRLIAAALVLAGGAIHLSLWSQTYRAIPVVGPSFLVNAAASVLVAVAVVVSVNRWVVAAGLGLAVSSLVALTLSRTVGFFGFLEGWTPEAAQTVAAEVGAIVAILAARAVTTRRATV